MIYAKIHEYNGTEKIIITRKDKPDNSWKGFDVPDEDWLKIEAGINIVVKTSEEANMEVLKKKQSAVWEKIKEERDKRKSGGAKVDVNGVTKWFHSDDPSRIKIIALVLLGAQIPTGIQWKTMDGSFVVMTAFLASEVFKAIVELDTDLFSVAEWHNEQMRIGTQPEYYDYSIGWPEKYEGN